MERRVGSERRAALPETFFVPGQPAHFFKEIDCNRKHNHQNMPLPRRALLELALWITPAGGDLLLGYLVIYSHMGGRQKAA